MNRKAGYGLEIPCIYCLYRSPDYIYILAHAASGRVSLRIKIRLFGSGRVVSAPSLHRESTDSIILVSDVSSSLHT